MNSTSIQNIINTAAFGLEESDIKMLFTQKTYPQFQLGQFKYKEALAKKQTFQFFLRILQNWNLDLQTHSRPLNDSQCVKNKFIYSWLKRLAVQNQKQFDSSLAQLYAWYNSSKPRDPILIVKQENNNRSRLEEWQIRNSYKSNLPLEIDNYKRRFMFSQNNSINQKQVKHDEKQLKEMNSELVFKNYSSNLKKENNFLRAAREDKESSQQLSNYRKSKVYFYRNLVKNYYKPEFDKDKLTTIASKTQNNFYSTDFIKNYRIKTSIGLRPIDHQQSLSKTTYSNFYRAKKSDSTNNKSLLMEIGDEDATFDQKLPLVCVDNIRLMSNPFDIKIKKKNKK